LYLLTDILVGDENKLKNLEVYVSAVLEPWPDLMAEPPEHGEAKDGAGSMSNVSVMELLTDEVPHWVGNTN